jgi:hypothetical protein
MSNQMREACASGVELPNHASDLSHHSSRCCDARRGEYLSTGPNPERVNVNVSGWPRGRQMLPAHPSSMTGGS